MVSVRDIHIYENVLKELNYPYADIYIYIYMMVMLYPKLKKE